MGLNQLKRDLISHKAVVIAVNFSKERFIKENWIDRRETPWKRCEKEKVLHL